MEKIDHRQTLGELYRSRKGQPVLLDVPPMNFLMVDGYGRPPCARFEQAAGTLFPVAYTLKFMVRASHDLDYHVMPMEVRWHVNRRKKEFAWTMMLMQPEIVTTEMVREAVARVGAKGGAPLLTELRFENFTEGSCVQYMHVGPYEAMDAAMDVITAFAERQGVHIPARNAHDIYLNDVRQTRPENLKSIMRFSVEKRAN